MLSQIIKLNIPQEHFFVNVNITISLLKIFESSTTKKDRNISLRWMSNLVSLEFILLYIVFKILLRFSTICLLLQSDTYFVFNEVDYFSYVNRISNELINTLIISLIFVNSVNYNIIFIVDTFILKRLF